MFDEASLAAAWVRAMRRGAFEEAWRLSDRRLGEPPDPRRFELPRHLQSIWDGRSIDGQRVLVRCYHGLGDTIQFLRFVPELRRRAASVTLEIQPRLADVLCANRVADRIVPFDADRPLPAAECDVEIMELSFALRAAPSDYPPPYLHVPPAPLP